jgi:hypothetical protein
LAAFEQLVSEILWMEGYWVRHHRDGSLIFVACRGGDNLLRVVECKSYLDSAGVALRAFDGNDERFAKRFKLFGDRQLRNVVFWRLRQQFAASGACKPAPVVKLCLACGRIASNADREGLNRLFAQKGWELWDEPWLRQRLRVMSERGRKPSVRRRDEAASQRKRGVTSRVALRRGLAGHSENFPNPFPPQNLCGAATRPFQPFREVSHRNRVLHLNAPDRDANRAFRPPAISSAQSLSECGGGPAPGVRIPSLLRFDGVGGALHAREFGGSTLAQFSSPKK